jgi:soluble epoxide hydrolase / lipid-phosphate phosphatase
MATTISTTVLIQSHTFTTKAQKPYTYLTTGPSGGPLLFFLHGWPGVALTWKPQLLSFASLGFYCVAPDMPGYGGTWTSKKDADFEMEPIVNDMLEILHHLGRQDAVWIGHDWGCGPLYCLAAVHPEACRAIAGLSVPYRTLELGLPALLETVDRELYPESEYPYGQWDYQVFYEQDSQAIDRQFEADIPRLVKLLYGRSNPSMANARGRTTNVSKDKGWFGGPNANPPDLPLDKTVMDQQIYDAVVASARKNGWHGASAWYLNHAANRKWTLENCANDGVLEMPVLFIHNEYDSVCQTVHNPKMMKPMRDKCENLTEVINRGAHWGHLELPEVVNAAIVEWIGKHVARSWPGPELKVKGKL